jgi:hypothetical protein
VSPAQRLTEALGGKWHGSYGAARCPVHDDGRPSLSIRDGESDVIVHCFSGCASHTVVEVLRRRNLWPAAQQEPRRVSPATPTTDRNRECALRIWGEASPLARSLGAGYLVARGIKLPAPPSLRWHRGLKHKPTGLTLPAMVAAIQAPDRSTCAIQRTFLSADGTRKATVSDQKMTLGAMGHGAVRLAAAGEVLGICEGIETGLSAMQLFSVPTWCSLGAERLGKIELPSIVRRVVIFGDRGAEAQAERARAAYAAEGREVEIRYPEVGKDFNDTLLARSAEA